MDHNQSAETIISHFNLKKHPEGGSFVETYRSLEQVNGRNIATGIYFLLEANEKSHFHKIKSDEMWHFYLGDPLELYELGPLGNLKKTIIGPNFKNGELLQYVVPAGNWFAARPLESSSFSFVGCTVSPGFDFRDFQLASRESLVQLYPQHQKIIELFT